MEAVRTSLRMGGLSVAQTKLVSLCLRHALPLCQSLGLVFVLAQPQARQYPRLLSPLRL